MKTIEEFANRIICGDNLNVMPDIPDNSIDLVITSPPYNLGYNRKHHTGNKEHCPYPDNIKESEYQDWQIAVLNELYRILKPHGSLLYNHKNRIAKGRTITPYQWILKTPFIVKQEIVWFNGSQNFDKCRFYPMTERIYWLSKNITTGFFNHINHHDMFNMSEWHPVGTRGEHTRAFPEQMCIDVLKCFPDANIILDPYMGWGTTAIACIKTGRKYIGIELDAGYVEIAEKRIKETNQQLTMF